MTDDERRMQNGEDSDARASTSSEDSFELVGHLGMPKRSTEGRRLRIPPEQGLGCMLLLLVLGSYAIVTGTRILVEFVARVAFWRMMSIVCRVEKTAK